MKSVIKLATLLLPLLLLSFCDGKGPYVELNGRKLTEKDLEKDSPEQYAALRKDYESKVTEMLEELANKKIIEMEAKAAGKSSEDFIQEMVSKAAIPSDAQIENAYNQLKNAGRVDKPLSDVRGAVMQMLMRENERSVFAAEMNRLKEKYKLSIPYERIEVAVGSSPVRGNPNGKVTIIEFTDFECPFCRKAQDVNQKIMSTFGNEVKWVSKHYPLDFHPNAMRAHIAAVCVNKQSTESYWKFYDGVFSEVGNSKEILEWPNLRNLAGKLGVNLNDYDTCVKDPATEEVVKADIAEGQKAGVTGTPAFFINGRLVSGAMPFEAFEQIIRQEL